MLPPGDDRLLPETATGAPATEPFPGSVNLRELNVSCNSHTPGLSRWRARPSPGIVLDAGTSETGTERRAFKRRGRRKASSNQEV